MIWCGFWQQGPVLINEYDASKLAKEIGLILGSKGGGGRKDFAQASGGSDIC